LYFLTFEFIYKYLIEYSNYTINMKRFKNN